MFCLFVCLKVSEVGLYRERMVGRIIFLGVFVHKP